MNVKNLFVIQRLAPITQYQDLGRFGHLHEGFSHSGAMDEIAFVMNNRLLGNDDNTAQLEIAPGGLHLKCLVDCTIAISGAYQNPTLNSKPLVNFCATQVHADDVLAFGFANVGQFSYLAVAGGFSVTPFLGSSSTTKRLQIYPNGEALTVGSFLTGQPIVIDKLQGERRHALPDYREKTLDIVPAHQHQQFSTQARDDFTSQPFIVDASDRMGTRLSGKHPISWSGGELLSEGLLAGSVQIPPDGNPIVLQKDAQSIGGYPKIGRLTPQSQALLAQKQVGEKIHFRWVAPSNG